MKVTGNGSRRRRCLMKSVKKPFLRSRTQTGGSQNHESSVIRNYLDLLLGYSWVTEEKKNIDIVQARRVLDNHHNGLEKVKERIVQHLAVMKLPAGKTGVNPALCRPSGHRKDEPWKKYCRSARTEIRPCKPWRGPG